jgi:peptidoglycan/LPS O-acetylase OafA/YrhL
VKNILRINIEGNRVFGLDILRAAAILFVLLTHAKELVHHSFTKYVELFIFDGVSIFFVLSGFLIGGILIRTILKNGASLKTLTNFWIRRWFRTLPNYLFILSILIILNLLFVKDFKFNEVLNYFIFSQNLYYPHPDFFPEAWSLTTEEWFYLLTPTIIFLLMTVSHSSIKLNLIYTALAILIFVTLFRYYRFSNLTEVRLRDWDMDFRKQVITRLDSLMYGVIGAYIAYYYKSVWLKYKNSLLLIGLFLFSVLKTLEIFNLEGLGIYKYVFSFSLESTATLCLLPYLANFKQTGGKLFKPITYMSLTSYSMYLINLTLVTSWIMGIGHIRFSLPWIPSHSIYMGIAKFFDVFAFFIITSVLSILIYKYFELPFTALREKVEAKKNFVEVRPV